MLTIRRVRADSDRVRERVHRHHGESDNLAGNLIVVNNRIGIGAGCRVVHIAETGGQRSGAPGCIECPTQAQARIECKYSHKLLDLPETVGETDIVDGHSKRIIRGHRTRRQRPAS